MCYFVICAFETAKCTCHRAKCLLKSALMRHCMAKARRHIARLLLAILQCCLLQQVSHADKSLKAVLHLMHCVSHVSSY